MTSIVICSVPRTNDSIPNAALGILKSCLVEQDIICHTIDTNVELASKIKNEPSVHKCIDHYFQTDLRYITQENIDIKEFLNKRCTLPPNVYNIYDSFLKDHVNKILSYNTEWIGISLLSINSILACIDLCYYIRQKSNVKIVLGGPGVSTFGIMGTANFGQFMIENNLATNYIVGEGEYTLPALLKNKEVKTRALNLLPIPDYSDLNFDLYSNSKRTLYITGSRGCVRNCSFCDIRSAWKKYTFRSGFNIAEEILIQYKKHQCINFQFTDSLINGNLKTFKELLDTLIKYKKDKVLPDELGLYGQFICRPQKQFKEEWYQKMSAAGIKQLHIGFESGSEDVLKDIGKKLKSSDMDYMMKMLLKYKIQCDMLMIVGYPTETEKDFQDTIDMLKRYQIYSDQGVVSGVNLGKTMVILPGSPIGENKQKWGIMYDEDENWISTHNKSLDFKERLRRRIRIQHVCQDLGYPIRWPITTLNTLYKTMNKNKLTI